MLADSELKLYGKGKPKTFDELKESRRARMPIEFNGWNFDEAKHRKRMRYLVVTDGDLDLNNAYAFKSKKELNEYLKGNAGWREPLAVFKIEDITL